MRAPLRSLLVLGLTVAAACGDDTGPVPSLQGHWLVTAFQSDGVAASAVSGTADFDVGGTATFNALITFPGEPQDTVATTFTWSQSGAHLILTDSVESGEWELTFGSGGSTVVLQLLNDASASRLTLARP